MEQRQSAGQSRSMTEGCSPFNLLNEVDLDLNFPALTPDDSQSSVTSLNWKRAMVTCYLRYVVDPFKLKEFEHYARLWIPLVEKFGGQHHGYFLPHEGANNIAVALFSFPNLAAYEEYRHKAKTDTECQAAMKFYAETKCFLTYERSFMKPVFDGVESTTVGHE